jgi:ABC-type Fe3+/spermidine/putrescine transport system ATPase subunit
MQVELLRLQRSLGTTFILVTHSQEEALTMSGRVVLLNHGHVIQDGPPQDLFDNPHSRFAADFMGIENVLEGRLVAIEQDTAVALVNDTPLHGRTVVGGDLPIGSPVFIAVRAERVHTRPHTSIGSGADHINEIPCRRRLKIYRGNSYDLELETPIGTIICRQADALGPEEGYAVWNAQHCVIGLLN